MQKKPYSKGSATISISMPAEMLDRLNEAAEKSELSRNGLIITAIAKEIGYRGPDNK
jgi:metal-responsive CopG/Arc/MetJ family transcriptional regulator